jgi:opacity protein-like surface antigen
MRLSIPAALLLSFTLTLAAQPANNDVRLSYGRSYFSEDVADNAYANTIGLTYNRFRTPHLSTRFGVTQIGADLAVDLGGDNEVQSSVWTASAEYHPLRERRLSPWAGLGVAYVQTDIGARHFDASPSNEFTGLLTGGVDVNMTRRLSIGADLAYLHYKPDLGAAGEINMSPLTFSGSLKLHW